MLSNRVRNIFVGAVLIFGASVLCSRSVPGQAPAQSQCSSGSIKLQELSNLLVSSWKRDWTIWAEMGGS